MHMVLHKQNKINTIAFPSCQTACNQTPDKELTNLKQNVQGPRVSNMNSHNYSRLSTSFTVFTVKQMKIREHLIQVPPPKKSHIKKNGL